MSFDDLISYFTDPTAIPVYTLPKTMAYAFVLILAALGIYEILKRLNVKIDRRLAIAIVPYVIFGSSARVLRDAGLTDSYWLVTPGIYVFVAAVTIATLGLSLFMQKKFKFPYFKLMFAVGLVLAFIPFIFLRLANTAGAAYALLLYMPWVAIFYFVKWKLENKIVVLTHMFDATVTYVATSSYGLIELHVLPTFLLSMHPASFIFVKLVAIVAFLLLIDRYAKDEKFALYLKMIVAILGAATGARDFIEMTSLG
ncbi:DUF63 family protein [archaeon]|nr:MAG: DUF63 family protein [archaeon]